MLKGSLLEQDSYLCFMNSRFFFFPSKLRIWAKVPRPWRQLGFLLLQYLSLERILHLTRGTYRGRCESFI